MTLRLLPMLVGAAMLLGCPPDRPPVNPVPISETVTPVVKDPDPVVDEDVTIAYENGLRILVKRIPSAELASMQLYIRGGARFRTHDNAGLEALALRTAVTGGTKAAGDRPGLDKDAYSKKLTTLGSTIGAGSTHGFSLISAKALTRHFAETFDMMAGAFLHPAMPETEVALQKDRMLVGIKRREVTPDGRLRMLVKDVVYTGHPYEHLADGNVDSIGSATAASATAHLASLRTTSRLQIVVVGNIEAGAVRDLVRQAFGDLARGNYAHQALPVPQFDAPKLQIVEAELPTNYIEASFIGPQWGDDDFAAGILAMRVLRARLFEEVRTKRNLSYAPSARFGWGGEVTRGSLYVTAVKANETMEVMLGEARRLQTDLVPAKVLAGTKSVYLTDHLMGNESTNGQAGWLALCDIVGGDWRLSRSLPDAIKAVTAEQVRDFAKKRMRNLQTVVLGDAGQIDRALFEGPLSN